MLFNIRRAAALAAKSLDGIAATWTLQSDGYALQKGAFAEDVARLADGEILPILWMHDLSLPPVGHVKRLEEAEEGLRFAGALNTTGLARSLEATIPEGTTKDISVDIAAFEVSPQNPQLVTRARLREISVCTTGLAVDQGAGIGRSSLWDMAQALGTIAELKDSIERLTTLLSREGYAWEQSASDETAAAVLAEAADLKKFLGAQFKALNG